MSYADFLARKAPVHRARGLSSPVRLAPHLFDFQSACADFGLRAGSWGCYLDTGLGKIPAALE